MKHFLLFLLLFCAANTLSAQSFYDINQIQEIRIYFGFTDWDTRMDTSKAGAEGYTLADSVVINGTTFLDCGVKYKGNSTYSAARVKNPLHIKLDYTTNANYQGYEDVKLGNGWSDNSMIREPLSYRILGQYMDAPKGNFAKVWINNVYYGLMNNAENIDKKFLLENIYTSNRTFVKCNPLTITGSDVSSLAYLGTNVNSYNTKYELKSDLGWDDLIHLCDTLNNQFSAFNSIADIDKFLWMLAFNNATVNLDSYTGSFRQNYYLYRNHANQWSPIVWDLNMCFGGFANAGGTAGSLTPTSMRTMSYTLHKTETGWPLINKLLNDPFYSKMYDAHLRTINNENFTNVNYKTLANSLHALVDAEVQNDPNFLSTYADFQLSLTSNTNGSNGAGTSPGIFTLMDSRASYLSNVLSAAPPVITNIVETNATIYGNTAVITANVTNRTNVYLGYRFKKSDRFVRIQMFDDGTHGDGSAGDNVYGASFVLNSLATQYYIYAENVNTGVFSPERAEHEFYEINPTIAMAVLSDLTINEMTANNATGIENEAGKSKDWIEILNKTNNPLGLSNIFLSNDVSNLAKWRFPADAVILPNQHLLVWADDLDSTFVDMHTSFNLNALGQSLYLSDATTSIAEQVSFGVQNLDYSYGRCADGVGGFTPLINRTPRTVNDCNIAIEETTNLPFSLYPNPTSNLIQIESSVSITTVEVFDINGRTLLSTNQLLLDVSELSAGYYSLRIVGQDGKMGTMGFVKM
jgi:CotH kinase protein/Lamin Tail Domain/Secretion system C-terminal sorting domain